MLQVHPAEESCDLDKQMLSLWPLISDHMWFSLLIYEYTCLGLVSDSNTELGMPS